MLYTISEIAVIILRLEVFSSFTLMNSRAVTILLMKLEYNFTLSILVYNTFIVTMALFIYSHWKLLMEYTRPNAKIIRGLLPQVNENVAMRSLGCLTINFR